jgi:hypothetical protein
MARVTRVTIISVVPAGIDEKMSAPWPNPLEIEAEHVRRRRSQAARKSMRL